MEETSLSRNLDQEDKIVRMEIQQYYEGPLPPPEILKRFNSLVSVFMYGYKMSKADDYLEDEEN